MFCCSGVQTNVTHILYGHFTGTGVVMSHCQWKKNMLRMVYILEGQNIYVLKGVSFWWFPDLHINNPQHMHYSILYTMVKAHTWSERLSLHHELLSHSFILCSDDDIAIVCAMHYWINQLWNEEGKLRWNFLDIDFIHWQWYLQLVCKDM